MDKSIASLLLMCVGGGCSQPLPPPGKKESLQNKGIAKLGFLCKAHPEKRSEFSPVHYFKRALGVTVATLRIQAQRKAGECTDY